MSARRYRAAGVLPLELWDVLIDGVPLYLLPSAMLPHAVAQLALQLYTGSARRRRPDSPLPGLQIDAVVLAGGGANELFASALNAAGFATELYPDPVWVGECGGLSLLAELSLAGAVMEIGQTSVKLSDAQGRDRTARSFAELPLESDVRDASLPEQREKLLAFFASILRARSTPAGLVLALPCEVDDSLAVAGCSYAWQAGDPQLVNDLLRAAQLEDVPTLVLNDAELAGISVELLRSGRSDPLGARAQTAHGTLVLTLGLGLGAAYLPGRAER